MVAPAQLEPGIHISLVVGLGLSGARRVCGGLFLGAAVVVHFRVSSHGDAGERVQGHERAFVVVRVEIAYTRPLNHRLDCEPAVVDHERGSGVVLVGELEYEFIWAGVRGFAKSEACCGRPPARAQGRSVLEQFGGELRDGVYELTRHKVGQLYAAACCWCGQEAVVDRENEGAVHEAGVVTASLTPSRGRTRRSQR